MRQYCSTGEKWDQEGRLEDSIKVRTDLCNGDVIIWQFYSEDLVTETRLNPDAAVRLGLTLINAVIDKMDEMNEIYKTIEKLIKEGS